MNPAIERDTRLRKIQAAFEKRRRALTWLAVLAGALIGITLLVNHLTGSSKLVVAILFVVAFLFALLVHLKIWRCPACDGHLGRLYFGLKLPKYCPHCGVALVREQ